MKENEYECAVCHNVYEKELTEEEARREEKELFGVNDPDAVLICDDCYKTGEKALKEHLRNPRKCGVIIKVIDRELWNENQ